VRDAEGAARAAGLGVYALPEGSNDPPCIDGRGTVILRQRGGVVVEARPGVPAEVEED
jgi:hypothetical protein